MTEKRVELTMSRLTVSSEGGGAEDWDRSLILNEGDLNGLGVGALELTPQNSVTFPAEGGAHHRQLPVAGVKSKRTLSELLRLHSEEGTDCNFSPEEASRVADVLGQWINASSSPYESDDDFFSSRAHDDSSIRPKRLASAMTFEGRPRGQSESVNSRPSTLNGNAKS
ncbi:hypothetical protein BDN72DRAFT_798802 [Pluteus cervinus]|uniref:Uncharacterized protein n=1 Tax=Pluteus cervinus TaxID=181527 RepID=A0ACD3APX5_9AGAR|nr:hypothetical protein BDN72DRAFT_798802 [Pluteus cervinus]